MNRAYQGRQDNPLEDLKQELSRKAISQFTEREIFHPEGYAKKVMEMMERKRINITAVQLRKVFQEFKAIRDGLKKDENVEEALKKLYKLYAILEYQAKRGVLNDKFKELMFTLFDNLERNKSKEAFEKAYDLLMAMVAYSKKS